MASGDAWHRPEPAGGRTVGPGEWKIFKELMNSDGHPWSTAEHHPEGAVSYMSWPKKGDRARDDRAGDDRASDDRASDDRDGRRGYHHGNLREALIRAALD